jgi:hypothetical protein
LAYSVRRFSRVVFATLIAFATVISGVVVAAPANAAVTLAPVPLTPAAGGSVGSLAVTFTWAAGAADAGIEYRVRYSAFNSVNGSGQLNLLATSRPFTTATTDSATLIIGGTRYWQIGYREIGDPTTTWTSPTSFTVDSLAPIVTVVSPATINFGAAWDYSLDFTVIDASAFTWEVLVDSAVVYSGGEPASAIALVNVPIYELGLTTGTHSTSLVVTDAFSRVTTLSRDITIDASAPVITYSSPTPPTPLAGAAVAITGTAVDAEGNQQTAGALDFAIAPYVGAACGTPTLVAGTIDVAGAFSATLDTTALADGSYCITPLAEDTWGNVNGAFLLVSVDNVPAIAPAAGPSLPTMGPNPFAALLFSGFALIAGVALLLGARSSRRSRGASQG